MLIKTINFLDNKIIPFIQSCKTYKEYNADIKYEIYPIKDSERVIRLWVSYTESDDDGFIEYPLINFYFIIKGNKIKAGEKMKECEDVQAVYLKPKERKEFMRLVEEFING